MPITLRTLSNCIEPENTLRSLRASILAAVDKNTFCYHNKENGVRDHIGGFKSPLVPCWAVCNPCAQNQLDFLLQSNLCFVPVFDVGGLFKTVFCSDFKTTDVKLKNLTCGCVSPEHQNYFGVDENLGPVAVSIRREKLDEGKDGTQYNYRVTFRTSQVAHPCSSRVCSALWAQSNTS